jgi:hypothetical protein
MRRIVGSSLGNQEVETLPICYYFVIKTDQQSLKHILEQRVGTPMQQKWISKLLGYNFVVEYKQGKENKVADALSRKEDTDLKLKLKERLPYYKLKLKAACVLFHSFSYLVRRT